MCCAQLRVSRTPWFTSAPAPTEQQRRSIQAPSVWFSAANRHRCLLNWQSQRPIMLLLFIISNSNTHSTTGGKEYSLVIKVMKYSFMLPFQPSHK